MAGLRGSRAPLDDVTGTQHKDETRIISSLIASRVKGSGTPFDERVERVNRLRTAIVNGYYRVRSADIAHRLLDTMREGSGLRRRNEVADPTSLPPASVSSTEETTDATFRLLAASESAEEIKHE